MAEMRLIDANKVETGFDELCQSPYFKNDVNAKHGAETLMDLCVRSDSHKPNTIDPEALPIVRELREKLERVTAERDAAIVRIRQSHWCEDCKNNQIMKLCANECDCDFCGEPCYCENCHEGNLWEWRGPDGDNQ